MTTRVHRKAGVDMTDAVRTISLETQANYRPAWVDGIFAELKRISGVLDLQTAILNAHTATLAEHTAILAQHTAILARHTEILDKHSAQLDAHSQKFEVYDSQFLFLMHTDADIQVMVRELRSDVEVLKRP